MALDVSQGSVAGVSAFASGLYSADYENLGGGGGGGGGGGPRGGRGGGRSSGSGPSVAGGFTFRSQAEVEEAKRAKKDRKAERRAQEAAGGGGDAGRRDWLMDLGFEEEYLDQERALGLQAGWQKHHRHRHHHH